MSAAWFASMPVVDPRLVAVIGLGAMAVWFDFRTRRLPNALTFGASAAGVAFAALTAGLAGLGWSVAGWGVGLLVFLPLFALRGLGGGDVKLLAAFGAWLGPSRVFWTAVYGAIAGGLLVIPLLMVRGSLGHAVSNTVGLLAYWRVGGLRPHPGLTLDTPAAQRMPYALPIALGALAALWLRG